jgi:hypothetical protein
MFFCLCFVFVFCVFSLFSPLDDEEEALTEEEELDEEAARERISALVHRWQEEEAEEEEEEEEKLARASEIWANVEMITANASQR